MTEKKVSRPLAPQGKAVKQMGSESEADFKKLHYFLVPIKQLPKYFSS